MASIGDLVGEQLADLTPSHEPFWPRIGGACGEWPPFNSLLHFCQPHPAPHRTLLVPMLSESEDQQSSALSRF
eukprot:scaffold204865_cov13-Tisochrysis_lutea.AAC.1